MLRSRYVTLDASGGSAAGTISIAPSRLIGVHYRFSDPGVSGNLAVRSLDSTVFTKNGISPNDGVQQVTDPPLIAERTVVELASITGGGDGDTVKVAIFIED